MKRASEDNNTFLVDDPIWAEDFAPNGKRGTRRSLEYL